MRGELRELPAPRRGWRFAVWCALALAWQGCDSTPPFEPLAAQLVPDKPADHALAARDLQEQFRQTPHASNRKYAGKILELEGEVFQLGRNAAGEPFVALKGGGKGMLPIQCLVQQPEPWRDLAPGSGVKIKGQCARVAPGQIPVLISAVVTHSAGDTALPVSAEELTGAFIDDRRAAVEAFGQKWLRVSGKFAGVDTVNGAFFIDGRGNAQVLCVPADTGLAGHLDSGLKGRLVTALGRVDNGDRRVVVLKGCLPPYAAESSDASDHEKEVIQRGQP